ncbi:2Fe-2S iron-sulfur cluster binding domain-containing protein [Sphingomonas colocasiae]|uniref:2Fe-2S iron-sulfur cluster binding domain-containing protein n=2 Tax=Sphingomonas colocasiae TaxID=1848973 RepID=A0ABS7PST3_9SPHN|nr:2Fe-2S iron-sulfur cluster binding domain-containing protein [Sphingomonas colocasiae]
MAKVNFVGPGGGSQSIEIDDGISVMEGAVMGGIDGIDADCGGQLSCATCHVHVDSAWLSRLAPVGGDEDDLLDYAVGRDERSRLSCQIIMTPELDGLVLHVPETQH